MGLLMVWLSRRFIDETIRTGTTRDVITMVCWLVLTVVGGVLLRQVYYLLTTKGDARISASDMIRVPSLAKIRPAMLNSTSMPIFLQILPIRQP